MNTAENQIDRDVVWTMLQGIPAYDREVWIKVGMAIKTEFGDTGFSMFDDWSGTADNYDPKSVMSVWKSFMGRGVTVASLIRLAKDYGWTTDKPIQSSTPKLKPAPKETKGNTYKYALELWMKSASSDSVVASHLYAFNKGINWAAGAGRVFVPNGVIVGTNADCIIVPVRTQGVGKVQAVQCINSEGFKQTFGRLSGGYLLLGNTLDKALPWYVCEGWASAVSMVFHHQKGNGVCAASFGKTNLERVANQIAEDHQPDEVIILQEVDQ